MKYEKPRMVWHSNTAILSLDLQPGLRRLATAGGDGRICIWYIKQERLESEATSKRDFPVVFASWIKTQGSVNVVRFSPTGKTLALAGATGEISFWEVAVKKDGSVPEEKKKKKQSKNGGLLALGEEKEVDMPQLENWQCVRCLFGSRHVIDLSWSRKGDALATSLIDGRVQIWDLASGRSVESDGAHQEMAQGVAWDPSGRWVVTQSCDRTCRVYTLKTKSKRLDIRFVQTLKHWPPPTQSAAPAHEEKREKEEKTEKKMEKEEEGREKREEDKEKKEEEEDKDEKKEEEEGKDENKKEEERTGAGVPPLLFAANTHSVSEKATLLGIGSYRRLAFSPDGTLLATPSGHLRSDMLPGAEHKTLATSHAVFLFRTGQWKAPIACIFCDSPAFVVRFCPLLFQHRPSSTSNPVPDFLPHRLVFAVGTAERILLFDTDHGHAIAVSRRAHRFPINDLTWSADGRVLIASSNDGYCSFITFSALELGTPVHAPPSPHTLPSPSPSPSPCIENKTSVSAPVSAPTCTAESALFKPLASSRVFHPTVRKKKPMAPLSSVSLPIPSTL